MPSDCDLLLPCKDEARALPALLAQVPDGFDVIVVDNGSGDGTARVAADLGARVVHEPQPGYGAAVQAGVAAARHEFLAVLDGDGSLDPRELPALLAVVRQGRATMASGRRRATAAGVWPWHARAGNRAVLWWLRRRHGLAMRDIAPMRVCRRADLVALDVGDRRFGYPVELLRKAAEAGWVISEHEVTYRPRAAGTRSKVSGSVPGTLRAARDFVRALS